MLQETRATNYCDNSFGADGSSLYRDPNFVPAYYAKAPGPVRWVSINYDFGRHDSIRYQTTECLQYYADYSCSSLFRYSPRVLVLNSSLCLYLILSLSGWPHLMLSFLLSRYLTMVAINTAATFCSCIIDARSRLCCRAGVHGRPALRPGARAARRPLAAVCNGCSARCPRRCTHVSGLFREQPH